MFKFKKIFAALIVGFAMLFVSIMPARAAAPWNVTGNYEITFMLTGDLTPYVHHASLTQTGSNVTGSGGYPATGGDTYHWNITSGNVSGDTINLTVAYDLGAPGTVMHMTGNIASNGTVTGTWDDNFGGPRTGTWTITKGVSVPLIHTPANGSTVSQANMVKVDWTDSVGSNPPFKYQYQAYSDPNYTVLVYDSGMTLTQSEIPTPGTPPGDYYIRVSASNGVDTSDWSNGASNPYHIKVVLNDFVVPAECNQNIVYNKIEGTNSANNITGTSGNDLILAKGGADNVDGKGGNDCIDGGDGADVLHGGGDDDTIIGGDGADLLYGDGGVDNLYGNQNADNLYGGAGNDFLVGGAAADRAFGEGGNSDTCDAEVENTCEL